VTGVNRTSVARLVATADAAVSQEIEGKLHRAEINLVLGLASPVMFASSPVSCLLQEQYTLPLAVFVANVLPALMLLFNFCACHYQKTFSSALLLPCGTLLGHLFLLISFLPPDP